MKIPTNVKLFKGTFEQLVEFCKFQDLPAGFIFFTDVPTEAEHDKKIDDYVASHGITRAQFDKISSVSGCMMHFTWLDKEGHHLIGNMVFGIARRHPKLKFVAVTDSPELQQLLNITEQLPDLRRNGGD